MSDCRGYQELIKDFLADEISSKRRIDLKEHLEKCSECAALLEMHQNLLALGEDIPMPEEFELRDMREAVLATTAKPSGFPAGFLSDLGKLRQKHPVASGFYTGFAAAAVLAFAIFLGGVRGPGSALENNLIKQSAPFATLQPAHLPDYLDSPFSYANVTIRRMGEEQLALSFDAVRHVDMQVAHDSILAREVLLQAMMEPSSMGSQLAAMEATPEIGDDRLKDALIFTMLDDEDAVVRINALAVLVQYPYDQKTKEAFIQTLRHDKDVQMRLTVLEEFARQNVEDQTIREAVGNDDPMGTFALMNQEPFGFR